MIGVLKKVFAEWPNYPTVALYLDSLFLKKTDSMDGFLKNSVVLLSQLENLKCKTLNKVEGKGYLQGPPSKEYTLVLDLDETLVHFSK